jgi:hypothetical protein
MLEVTSGVLDADRRERFAQCLYQSVLRARSCFAQHTLDLGERFLYRIKVWIVQNRDQTPKSEWKRSTLQTTVARIP